MSSIVLLPPTGTAPRVLLARWNCTTVNTITSAILLVKLSYLWTPGASPSRWRDDGRPSDITAQHHKHACTHVCTHIHARTHAPENVYRWTSLKQNCRHVYLFKYVCLLLFLFTCVICKCINYLVCLLTITKLSNFRSERWRWEWSSFSD